MVSSWNDETSATTRPSAGKSSARAASGVPMLPPTKTGRGCSASSAPVSAVVVVLPLVPVMATLSAPPAPPPPGSSCAPSMLALDGGAQPRDVLRLALRLAQLQRRERQQRQRERDDPEPHDDLGLGPAGQFVVVV